MIDLCIAYKKTQQPSLTRFLENYASTKTPAKTLDLH